MTKQSLVSEEEMGIEEKEEKEEEKKKEYKPRLSHESISKIVSSVKNMGNTKNAILEMFGGLFIDRNHPIKDLSVFYKKKTFVRLSNIFVVSCVRNDYWELVKDFAQFNITIGNERESMYFITSKKKMKNEILTDEEKEQAKKEMAELRERELENLKKLL